MKRQETTPERHFTKPRYLELHAERRSLLPHWERRNGMDHIFIFGDQGTNYFPRWREFMHESVFLLTEGLTPGCGPSCYQPWKDVIIPGHTDFFRCAASGGGQIEHMRWPNVR